MSDIMRPIPFAQLMDWILTEHAEKNSIFGVRKIVKHEGGADPIFAEKIETPFGPAAGPNSQLQREGLPYEDGGRCHAEADTYPLVDADHVEDDEQELYLYRAWL